ncbi:hypothetical protein [Oxynema aestuarii]|uniref:Uncharacterized protein n=1 Tax=Oxynema aestuarii AP17 TaxID=2064643 RepID=A0A6H1TU77_9CYAN|nr:hypothetical protein [Oxynema aestuarii]QIZ69756.1 hypothetical protein HCG48_03485 [Oxynema aestuarii AP17]
MNGERYKLSRSSVARSLHLRQVGHLQAGERQMTEEGLFPLMLTGFRAGRRSAKAIASRARGRPDWVGGDRGCCRAVVKAPPF